MSGTNHDKNLADIFTNALAEEGLLNVDVMEYDDPARQCDIVRISKRINGEKFVHEHTISQQELLHIDDIEQYIAILAGRTARLIHEELTDLHTWGEKAVLIDLSESYNAVCQLCGAEACIDDLNHGPMRLAETATPQPVTNNYRSLPDIKLRFTLLALLQQECESFCPNSPIDRKF